MILRKDLRKTHVFFLTFLIGSLISSTCEIYLGFHLGLASQLSDPGQVHWPLWASFPLKSGASLKQEGWNGITTINQGTHVKHWAWARCEWQWEDIWRSMLMTHVLWGLRQILSVSCVLSQSSYRSSDLTHQFKGKHNPSIIRCFSNLFSLRLQSKTFLLLLPRGVTSPLFPPKSWIGLSLNACHQLSSLTSAPHACLWPFVAKFKVLP